MKYDIEKIVCIYCHEKSALKLHTSESCSSDGWGYYICLNPDCGHYFTEMMRNSPKEQWDHMLQSANIPHKARTITCPYCNKNAYAIDFSTRIELLYACSCGNYFNNIEITQVLFQKKIETASLPDLQQMIETEFVRVEQEKINYGSNMNEKLDLDKLLKVFHERLKRLESVKFVDTLNKVLDYTIGTKTMDRKMNKKSRLTK